MGERIPTADDIREALRMDGWTHDEANEGIDRIKQRGIGIGQEMARETMQASIGDAVRKLQRIAWDEGWEAAVGQAPGDTWFDEWHYRTNPYRKDEGDE